MLKLKNIKREGNIITANYVPEDSKEEGFIKMNCETFEVIEKKLTTDDGNNNMYFRRACYKLETMIKSNDIREEVSLIWY